MRRHIPAVWFWIAGILLGMACAGQPARKGAWVQEGLASWYGPGFQGKRTASGERFNMHQYTAAHRTLPFGTRVRVTHLRTGRSVVVRINDRGPWKRGRIIDLSYAAARAIGLIRDGVAPVRIEVVQWPSK